MGMDKGIWSTASNSSSWWIQGSPITSEGSEKTSTKKNIFFLDDSSGGPQSIFQSKVVLRNASGNQLAVVLKLGDELRGMYKIYSPKSRYPGQQPVHTVFGTILYRWAQVVQFESKLSMQVWNGSAYGQIYTSERKDSVTTILTRKPHCRPVGLVQFINASWHIEASSDINCALVLCFAAILDDLEFLNPREHMPRSKTV
jgi:hypothetical protein